MKQALLETFAVVGMILVLVLLLMGAVTAIDAPIKESSELPTTFYRVHMTSVYDGDTVTGDVHLGYRVKLEGVKFRLLGINTPEVRTKDAEEKVRGYAARDHLRSLILDKDVIVEAVQKTDGSNKQGKYGRFLATIWICDPRGACANINEHLVTSGHAVRANY